MRDILLVVTPCRNAESSLEQTILSVVQQRGNFEIYYHVQDGGSTDGTLGIAQRWIELLHNSDGRFHGGAQVHMSWDSRTDDSMYDAIQTGFESLLRKLEAPDDRRIVMTWINADDLFAPGAFKTVMTFLGEGADRHWVTGIPSTITEDGMIADVRDAPYAYSRRQLALGWYDGRGRPFFQQEGTFWTSSLWVAAGGLNRRLKLAGDWDLWRRMARETGVTTVRAVLAHHRRRAGQLSGDMGPYWSEVDALRERDDGRQAPIPDDGDIGWMGRWNLESGSWITEPVNLAAVQDTSDRRNGYPETACMRLDFAEALMPVWVRHVTGLAEAEPWGRWSDAAMAPSVRISSFRPFPLRVHLRLKLAVFDRRCSPVVVTIGGQSFNVRVFTDPREITLDATPGGPADVIDIRPSMSFSPEELGFSDDPRRLGVALQWLEIAASQERPAQ